MVIKFVDGRTHMHNRQLSRRVRGTTEATELSTATLAIGILEARVKAAHSPASLPTGHHRHPRFQKREETSNWTRDSEQVIISGGNRKASGSTLWFLSAFLMSSAVACALYVSNVEVHE